MEAAGRKKQILNFVLNFSPVISAMIGILIGACFVALWGISPITFFAELIKGALGDKLSIGSTLNNAAPLLIAGSGTAIAFRAGANNIGQEGQLFLGGLGAATIALLIPGLPGVIGIPGVFIISFIFGMAFASIAVLFRLFKGVNELLVTLLLNYVGTLLVSAMVNGPFRSTTNVSYPQTDSFGEQFLLTNWSQFGYMHSGIFIAIAVTLVSGYFLWFTPMGLRIRNVGLSPEASKTAGSNPMLIFAVAMLISGGLCGLAGGVEVIGRSELLRQGFGTNMGFDSLAVALLGDTNPFGVLPAGLFFGALRTGMQTMQRSIGIPSALLDLVKGVIMISIMVGGAIKIYIRQAGAKKREVKVNDQKDSEER
jgi:simple sugar transport system permease protein